MTGWVSVVLKILEQLQRFEETGEEVDVFITTSSYEKEGAKTKIMRYTSAFPENQVFTWDDAKAASSWEIHDDALAYLQYELCFVNRIAVARHTFYVDNLFVFRTRFQYLSKSLYYMKTWTSPPLLYRS